MNADGNARKSPKNASTGHVEAHSDTADRITDNIDAPQMSLAQQFERSENPLGNSTNTPYIPLTTITNSPSAITKSAASMRYALQAKARDLMPSHRVAWCMRRFRGETTRVNVVQAKARNSAYFDGLMRCGRVWVCPVCASKIAETRREELSELLLAARETVLGYTSDSPEYYPRWFLTMITYTIQHKSTEACADVLSRLNRAWSRYNSGRWMIGFKSRFYVVGTLRALELTHSANGWHPHYHVLQFHDSYLRDNYSAPLYAVPSRREMAQLALIRWSECAAAIGGYSDRAIGVDLTVGEVQDYPIKSDMEREYRRWSMPSEMTKQTVKRGRNESRTLTDLLIDASRGDELAANLWIEGTTALARQKQLEPSKGLWEMLGRKLKSEDEAAEDEANASDEILASLTWDDWKIVLNADGRSTLLDIAAAGDTAALWSYLNSLGIHDDAPLAGVAA